MDGRDGGVVLPVGYVAVQLSNGELACLPHPVEESTLREHGLTWRQASRQGRLFRVEFKICERCGTLHEERRIYDGQAGCLPGVIGGFATIPLIHFGAQVSWIGSMFGGYFTVLAIWLFVSLCLHLKWRRRNKATRIRRCNQCAAKELSTIQKVAGKAIMCPFCHTKQMRYELAGIS